MYIYTCYRREARDAKECGSGEFEGNGDNVSRYPGKTKAGE